MEQLTYFAHYALSFFIVISVVVFIHEFGHYLIAKWCGVRVEAFSIGFGKELWGWTDRSGTRWKFSLLPLGGYVKMFGDASAASTPDDATLANMPESERHHAFHYKPLWKKAAVVVAGPVANFLLAIAIFTYFIFTSGLPSTEPVIGTIVEGSPAAQAGLLPNDRVLTIGTREVRAFSDIPIMISTNLGTPLDITIERSGETMSLILTPRTVEDKDAFGNSIRRPIIGIRSKEVKFKDVGFPRAIWEATARTYSLCVVTLQAIGQMLVGDRGTDELSGPLGIAKLSGQAAERGFQTTIWLIAMISANLGLVNLLPIPLLDGGHLAYYSIEALRGRPMAQRIQEYGYRFGFATLLTLMVFTLFNDLRHMFF